MWLLKIYIAKVIFFTFGYSFLIFFISFTFLKPGFSKKIFLLFFKVALTNLKFFDGGVAKKKNLFFLSLIKSS